MRKILWLSLLTNVAVIISGCYQEPFTISGIAEDHFFLKNGNQHMPVLVAGNVDSKKFVVILHGGPGGNSLAYRDNYVRDFVEKEFAIVYWDQRFAGNTQGNGGNTHITEFRKDIKRLLLLLKNRYGADKNFYLFAHSWGGFLAPYFLTDGDNQNLVKGWIQIGGAHNYHLNDSLTKEMLLHYGNIELAAGNNITDWNEIVEWCRENSFEGRDNAVKLNRFAHIAERLIEDVAEPEIESDLVLILQNALLSQGFNQLASGIRQIDAPAYNTPNTDQLYRIQLPTLLLWGKYDFVCPLGLAEDIEKHIGSTEVSKIIYAQSGHSPMANQHIDFWQDVTNWIKTH